MSGKVTVVAPSNIAFIKYWGARDLERAVPVNPSISMTLRTCVSRSTVEVVSADRDEIFLVDDDGPRTPPAPFSERIRAHLDRLRAWAGVEARFRVATRNSFPAGAGLASSASGFAALTLAVAGALGREPSLEERSELARKSGSGSAARSVLGGYVEWPGPGAEARIAAAQIAPPEHWRLCDVIAVVEAGAKEVPSLEGHRRAATSPHYERRQTLLPGRLDAVRTAIRTRDLERLGPVLEEEAIELHLIAMSSRPPIFYWLPGTIDVIRAVRQLRADGVRAFFTMDAGANVHVICEPDHEPAVADRLASLEAVRTVIRDGVGTGPVTDPEHLV